MFTIVKNATGTYDVWMESETSRFPTILNVKDSFDTQAEAVDFLNKSRGMILSLVGELNPTEVKFKSFSKI